MPQAVVWIFLVLASAFASVHNFAVAASLYWYYSWFDILMHFWGGVLIVLGVFSFCTFKHIPLKPTTVLVFGTLFSIMVAWEVFEIWAGLYEPVTFVFDVSKDLLVGSIGGLVGYLLMLRLKI